MENALGSTLTFVDIITEFADLKARKIDTCILVSHIYKAHGLVKHTSRCRVNPA
jgi:hypothetical protein